MVVGDVPPVHHPFGSMAWETPPLKCCVFFRMGHVQPRMSHKSKLDVAVQILKLVVFAVIGLMRGKWIVDLYLPILNSLEADNKSGPTSLHVENIQTIIS